MAERKAKTKEQSLRELAGKRIPKAQKAIALVGNLANYGPTAEQQQAIIRALTDAVATVQARFRSGKSMEPSFRLP